ncbi:MAG: hypothetical protein U9R19_04750 [Bacteroidota bacterium]|nr:hypothetical protein [Bacteroidota bacterium]
MNRFLRILFIVMFLLFLLACKKEENKRASIININCTGSSIDTLAIWFSFGQADRLCYYGIEDNDTTPKEILINTSAEIYYNIYIDSTKYRAKIFCGCGIPATSVEKLWGRYILYILEFDSVNNYYPIAFNRESGCKL